MAELWLYPTSDGSIDSWSNSSANQTNMYSYVDEASLNDADYCSVGNANNQNLNFGWQNHSTESGAITNITLYAQMWGSIANLQVCVLHPWVNFYGDLFTTTTSSTEYSAVYDTNPAGGSWTWANVDNLTSGIRSGNIGKSDLLYCSRMRIKVTYTPAATGNSNFFQLF